MEGAEKLLSGGNGKDFAAKLNAYIVKRGTDIFHWYDGVVSKTMFNKYRSGHPLPSKYTVVACAINVELTVDEINDLLSPLGEKLDEYKPQDKIIIEGIMNGDTVASLNEKLVEKGIHVLLTQAKSPD